MAPLSVARREGVRPGPRGGPGPAVVAAAVAVFALLQAPDFLRVPLVGDDYIVLDKTRDAGLSSIVAPRLLISHYYRPWSRELHFWVLQRLFGLRPAPYHLASAALLVIALALSFVLARRLAGPGAATLATAGAAALAGWGLLLIWAAGAQDLWMMAFALLALVAWDRGRTAWATAALALALLSKETAALVPALFVAHALLVARDPWARALRRAAPSLVVVAIWAVFHPLLGGRVLWPHAEPVNPGLHLAPAVILARTLLATLNLDLRARPVGGWAAVMLRAAAGALLLAALAAWGLAADRARRGRGADGPRAQADDDRPAARVALFGIVWALLGWAPLLMPSLGWHSYYALFGALGAWLALAVPLARRWWAGLVLIAIVAALRSGLAATPSEDWGTEWFQRRAAAFTADTHDALLRLRPALPRGSRVFLAGLPGGTGLVPGHDESPVLRVWYRDRTLRVADLDRYRMRSAGDSAGIDVFFGFDFASGWRELVKGAEDVSAAAVEPGWRANHERLAMALSRAADWSGASGEYAKLASAFPNEVAYPYYAGLACRMSGDSAAASRWLRRAAALPGADEEVRAAWRALAPDAAPRSRERRR